MSLRDGGVSSGPFSALNLGRNTGDAAADVAENRRRFGDAIGGRPVWLRQVHGIRVLRLTADTAVGGIRDGAHEGAGDSARHARVDGAVDSADSADAGTQDPATTADAAWTTEQGIACTVQVADCLPVLLACRDGSAVAAAHAGWRGLSAGVLEAVLGALCSGTGAHPSDVQVWLGPCIGPRRFEVGADVRSAFGIGVGAEGPDRGREHFVRQDRADGSPRWLANLQRLAQDRLIAAGVTGISTEPACTFEDASRFFSFRRDGVTGRMAAAIWRRR